MTDIFKPILLANAAATLAMFGVIWMVQLVQYPLFGAVGERAFAEYHAGHASRISLVVVPLMLVELATAVALVPLAQGRLPQPQLVLGLTLVGVAWGSTFFWQVPMHGRLSGGFDASAWRQLVVGNWLRTAAWSIRSALVLGWLATLLRRP